MSDLVRIWSHDRRAWWRENSRGYSGNIREAGLYPRAEAQHIRNHAGPNKAELRDVRPGDTEVDAAEVIRAAEALKRAHVAGDKMGFGMELDRLFTLLPEVPPHA